MNRDLIVIGGGSGGLSCAKAAASCGSSVTCFDHVQPSSQGSVWGLGGTCVNVGCIPKILFHHASQVGINRKLDIDSFGWSPSHENTVADWPRLIKTVQLYIKQLNFGYRKSLRTANVQYINAKAKLVNQHTVRYTLDGEQHELTAKYIVIAAGGRPYIPRDIPGAAEYAITSDDLFSLERQPGRVLIVGGSYIALECAGALNGLGFDVHVCVRSQILRGFDRQCAEKVGDVLRQLGCKFIYQNNIKSIEKNNGKHRLRVRFNEHNIVDEFDTVLYATGRIPNTSSLGCDEIGIELHPESQKILVNDADETSVANIYAVGDICHGRPELTPPAIKAGELLAERLFEGGKKLMDYVSIPTVVFTPVEYGACGLSEELAIDLLGPDNIEVFLHEFSPVHVRAAHWKKVLETRADDFDAEMGPISLTKLICKRDDMRILGFHCVSLNASEITQGYAVIVKQGLTKMDLDETVGIHPTDAESFQSLTVTRRSGQSWVSSGGCGGGKCG